jgi:hypothetical protein
MENEENNREVEDEFAEAVRHDLMVKSMTRIATHLERVLIGIYVIAGLLGFIAFMMALRLMIGR